MSNYIVEVYQYYCNNNNNNITSWLARPWSGPAINNIIGSSFSDMFYQYNCDTLNCK